MAKQRYKNTDYKFTDYDKHLCLKPSPGMWLVILFLLRPYVVIASSFRIGRSAGNVSGVSGLREMIYSDGLFLVLGVLASIPALLFVFVWIKRNPGAPDLYRKIWHKSALLLMLSAALSIVIVFLPLAIGTIDRINAIGWAQAVISAVIIPYLLLSKRARDVFMDFPDDASEDQQKNKVPGK